MNTIYPVETASQASVLADAIEDSRPALATWRLDDRWVTLKTRFVSVNHRGAELGLECDEQGQGMPRVTQGQHVSVSFRRGRGRCAFDTVVLGRGRASLGDGKTVSILRLEYPEGLCELQRRAYYRQQVPASDPVAVSLSNAPDETAPVALRTADGTLLDVSPDGMSVALPPGADLPADVDGQIDCTLRPEAQASPVRLRARVCSRVDLPDRRIRLGLQLVRNPDTADLGTGFAQLLARVRT